MEAPDGFSFSDHGPCKDRIITTEKDRLPDDANALEQLFEQVARL